MKGYYDEFGWIKSIAVVIFVLTFAYIFVSQFGLIEVKLTQSRTVEHLENRNLELWNELQDKCDPCPEVRCAGDMTLAGFLIGIFFGFVGGIWFTLNFGKKFAEVF